jgi:hypothetical protein
METAANEIIEIVNRETKSWDTQAVDLLMTVFHHHDGVFVSWI